MLATKRYVVEVDYDTDQQEGTSEQVGISLGQTIVYLLETQREGLAARAFPVRDTPIGDQEQ